MLITVEQVEDICDNVGLEYSSFTNTYSGRGMYGDRCVGWDVDSLAEIGPLAIAFVEVLGDTDGRTMAENVSTDNMGLGYIVYFRDVICPLWDEEQFEDNDDDY